jgi:hypothetical protein
VFKDPIIEEVRRAREEFAKQHNYDLHAMAEDLRKQEQEHRDLLVSFPAKTPRKMKAK